MRYGLLLPALALLCATAVCHADSLTYTFLYNGTDDSNPSVSDSGYGSLSYTYIPGFTNGTLSAFSFTDTLNAADHESSTYNYGFSDVSSSSIVTDASGQIVYIGLQTGGRTGSNSDFPAAVFGLYFGDPSYAPGGMVYSYTDIGAATSKHSADSNSSGSATLSLVPNATALTPEPPTMALVATGLLGVAGALRKRFSGPDRA